MPPAAPTTSADALTQLNNFSAGAKTPDQILASQNQAAGVDQAQTTLTGLRGAIANTTNLLHQVAPSIMGRTANSLVTSAQANRQIQNEQAPIQQNLTDEGTNYGNATQDFNMATDKASKAATLQYQGQQDQRSYLQNLYDTLTSKETDAAKMAEAKREFDAQQAESARQFNLTPHGTASTGTSGLDINSILDLLNGKKAPAAVNPLTLPGAVAKGAGVLSSGALGTQGYSFVNPTTKSPISAGTFANLNGVDIADVLKAMASTGDKTASTAYQELANKGGNYDQAFKNKYSSLFWGT